MSAIINDEDLKSIMRFPLRTLVNNTGTDSECPPNIVDIMNARQFGFNQKPLTKFANNTFKQFAEMKTTEAELNKTECDIPTSARSTFLMSFSSDCTKVASAHGDHNIYISDVKSGQRLKTLRGHVRTPWSITFHPACNEILASGCLAGEVRVWDLQGQCEKWKISHEHVIASLAFHPFLQLLVIAAGNAIYFWDWSQPKPFAYCCTSSTLERVRYVKFSNQNLITGIANSPYENILKDCYEKDSPACKNLEAVQGMSTYGPNYEQKTDSSSSSSLISLDSGSGSGNEDLEWEDIVSTANYKERHAPSKKNEVVQVDSDTSDSDTSDSISPALYSAMSDIAQIYESINETCTTFETCFEAFLQDNPQARQLIGSVPNDQAYELRPVGSSSRTPITALYDLIAAVRCSISFINITRNPLSLHSKLLKACQSLDDLSSGVDNLSENGCIITPELMDSMEVFRRKRKQLIALAKEIFFHMPRRSGRSRFRDNRPHSRRSITPHPDTLRLRFHSHSTSALAAGTATTSATEENFSLLDPTHESPNIFHSNQNSSLHRSSSFSLTISNAGHLREQRSNSSSSHEISERAAILSEFHEYASRPIYTRTCVTPHTVTSHSVNAHSGGCQLPHSPNTYAARAFSPTENDVWLVATRETSNNVSDPALTGSSQYAVPSFLNSGYLDGQNPSGSFSETDQNSSFHSNKALNNENTTNDHSPGFPSNQGNKRRKRVMNQQHLAKRQHLDSDSSVAAQTVNILEHPSEETTSNVPGSSSNTSSQSASTFQRSGLSFEKKKCSVSQEILQRSEVTDISQFVRPFNSKRSSTAHADSFDEINTPSTSRAIIPDSLVENDPFQSSSTIGVSLNIDDMERFNQYREAQRYDNTESLDDTDVPIRGMHLHNMGSDEENHIQLPCFDVARFSLIVHHRIQSWDFSKLTLPPIYDAHANIVVQKCMIHNDASVDISKDGKKLVALLLPEKKRDNKTFRFGLYSLSPMNLGYRMCVWGYIIDPVSLSFSPLGQYVMIGSATSGHWRQDRSVVIDVIKFCVDKKDNNKASAMKFCVDKKDNNKASAIKLAVDKKDNYKAKHVRGFSRNTNPDMRCMDLRLNCVRWLPHMEFGFAYATNRGSLTICSPEASITTPERNAPSDPREMLYNLHYLVQPEE